MEAWCVVSCPAGMRCWLQQKTSPCWSKTASRTQSSTFTGQWTAFECKREICRCLSKHTESQFSPLNRSLVLLPPEETYCLMWTPHTWRGVNSAVSQTHTVPYSDSSILSQRLGRIFKTWLWRWIEWSLSFCTGIHCSSSCMVFLQYICLISRMWASTALRFPGSRLIVTPTVSVMYAFLCSLWSLHITRQKPF